MIEQLKRRLSRALDYWRVRFGRAERIAVPGQYVVWREGDAVMTRIIQPKGN